MVASVKCEAECLTKMVPDRWWNDVGLKPLIREKDSSCSVDPRLHSTRSTTRCWHNCEYRQSERSVTDFITSDKGGGKLLPLSPASTRCFFLLYLSNPFVYIHLLFTVVLCWLINLIWFDLINVFPHVCLSVCLSVSKITQKRVDELVNFWAWSELYFRCQSWIDFSDISYKHCYAEFYVGKIWRIRIGGLPLQRGVVLQWFYSLSRQNTFVRGTCALPSAILVHSVFIPLRLYAVSCGSAHHNQVGTHDEVVIRNVTAAVCAGVCINTRASSAGSRQSWQWVVS